MSLFLELKKRSQDLGFILSGGVDIDSATDFKNHFQRYQNWIDQGFHGEMQYLFNGMERRGNPRWFLPEAESVFCVAWPYPAHDQSDGGPRVARYLHGEDYHTLIKKKLFELMGSIDDSSLRFKICVDTSAFLDRTWAYFSGLGWIGKNTLLIHPKYGSYFFIGSILLNKKLNLDPIILPNYCGHCTRCLDSCPTSALVSQGNLDSRKCISYLTLEKRGPHDLDESFKKKMGEWIAGCDVCQEVCPFNLKISKRKKMEFTFDPVFEKKTWKEWLEEESSSYKKRVKKTALNRIKPEEMKRNLQIAYENYSQKKMR